MLKRVTEVILCLSFMVSSVGVSFSKDRAPKTTTKAQAQKETTLAEGTLKWRYKIGKSIRSSPAIGSDGTIYVGADDGRLYAINPNGTLKWRYQTYGKISSSPAIGSDGTIYVGSGDGYFYAINPDGTLKWCYETGGEIEASPAIGPDGTIYVISEDGYLYALNSNGTLKWRYTIAKRRYTIAYPGFHSPAVTSDGRTIYIACCDSLYAISSYGTLRWRYAPKQADWKQGEWFVKSSPVIGSDGTIYVVWELCIPYSSISDISDRYLYAMKPDGTLKWSSKLLAWGIGPACPPVIGADNALYVSGGEIRILEENAITEQGNLLAINPDGTRRWDYSIEKGGWSSPPAIGSDGTIYVGAKDGLHAIKPKGIEATEKWCYKTGGWIWSSPAIGPDGTIYVGSEDGYLYAIQGSGKLADTPWPMFGHDLRHTGRAGK